MEKISAVVTAINGEDKSLASCLSSVRDFVSEIVIVDMSQGAEIKKVAKKFKAKVYNHDFVNYVEPVRNFGIQKAKNDWILILDPDEEVSKTLTKRLTNIIKENSADYVRIPRKNIVFGKILRHSKWWPDMNIRFFKKGFVSWDEIIHSVPMTQGRGMDLEAKDEVAITHHHYETIEQFVERLNRYTSVQASLKSKDYKFSWKDLIAKPIGEFLSRFFASGGYRDGIHGLGLSFLQSFSEVVVYLKIWQIQGFKEESMPIDTVINEIGKARKEISYWENNTLVNEKGGIIPRIKRKLMI